MSSVLSSSYGSDGASRPHSTSPQGNSSETSSVSNGSPVGQRFGVFRESKQATQFSQPPPPPFPGQVFDINSSLRSISPSPPLCNGVQGSPATWNHTELVQALMQNNEVLVCWLKEMNLLAKNFSCPKCTSPMTWETTTPSSWKTVDRYHWRCQRRSCSITVHMRSGSFFDRPFFVTLASFIEIIYWWAKGAPMAFVVEETGCGMEFLVYAYCLIREVCGSMMKEFVVGGPGAVTGWTDPLKLTINGMECENYLSTMQVAEKKWRQKYGNHPFQNILEHIATVYDVGVFKQASQREWNACDFSSRNNVIEMRRESHRGQEIRYDNSSPRNLPRGLYGSSADVSWKVEPSNLWNLGGDKQDCSKTENQRQQSYQSRRS